MTSSLIRSRPFGRKGRVRVQGHEVRRLSDGWQAAATAPEQCPDATALQALSWRAAAVPGPPPAHYGAPGSGSWESLTTSTPRIGGFALASMVRPRMRTRRWCCVWAASRP